MIPHPSGSRKNVPVRVGGRSRGETGAGARSGAFAALEQDDSPFEEDDTEEFIVETEYLIVDVIKYTQDSTLEFVDMLNPLSYV